MQHSETLGKIAPALVKALGEMEAVAKSAANPHFKSKFTPLDEVIETSRPILAANKLALMQFPAMVDGNKIGLETVIMHESGEWIAAMAEIFVSKPDPQQVGSAISYLRRYAQKAALNLADADDDAEGQMNRGTAQKPAEKPVSAYQAKKDGKGERYNVAKNALQDCASMTELGMWTKEYADEIKGFPEPWQAELREEYTIQRGEIEKLVSGQPD